MCCVCAYGDTCVGSAESAVESKGGMCIRGMCDVCMPATVLGSMYVLDMYMGYMCRVCVQTMCML